MTHLCYPAFTLEGIIKKNHIPGENPCSYISSWIQIKPVQTQVKFKPSLTLLPQISVPHNKQLSRKKSPLSCLSSSYASCAFTAGNNLSLLYVHHLIYSVYIKSSNSKCLNRPLSSKPPRSNEPNPSTSTQSSTQSLAITLTPTQYTSTINQ